MTQPGYPAGHHLETVSRRRLNRRTLRLASNSFAVLLLTAGLLGFFWLRQTYSDPFSREGLAMIAGEMGLLGPVLYVLLIALAVVISQIPGVPLAIAAGALWGTVPAAAYSVAGGFLGGMIAYFLGRTLGRELIGALTGKTVVFTKQRGERFLGWVILGTRLLPVLSFDIISYASGLSGISVRVYALATVIGMVPSTLLLTFLGSRFVIRPELALALSGVALLTLLALPLLLKRYRWLDDVVRIEDAESPDET